MQDVFSNSCPHGYFDVDIKQPQQLHVDLGLLVFHKLLFYVHLFTSVFIAVGSRTRSPDSMDFSLCFGHSYVHCGHFLGLVIDNHLVNRPTELGYGKLILTEG